MKNRDRLQYQLEMLFRQQGNTWLRSNGLCTMMSIVTVGQVRMNVFDPCPDTATTYTAAGYPQPATPRLSQVLLTPTDETARDCLRALLSRTDAKKRTRMPALSLIQKRTDRILLDTTTSRPAAADNSGSESDGSLGPVEREVAEILMASQEVSQSRSVSTLGLSKLVSSNAPRRRISKRKTRARTAVASAQLGTNSHSAKEAMVEPQRLVFDPVTRKRRRNYNHTDESSSRSKTAPLLPSGSVGFRDSQRSDRLYLSKVIDERRNPSGQTTHFRVRLRRRDSDVANCDDRVVWVRAEKNKFSHRFNTCVSCAASQGTEWQMYYRQNLPRAVPRQYH